jgi:hypothetical protein
VAVPQNLQLPRPAEYVHLHEAGPKSIGETPLYHLYLHQNYLVTSAVMSFGFSVSDFLAVIELANKIRRDFGDAPKQFNDIFDE